MAHSPLATQYIGENKNYSGPGYRTGKNLICLRRMQSAVSIANR